MKKRMAGLDALDHIAINELLCCFFLAFDERNWTSMADCLAPEVFIDYSSSGCEQPGTMTNSEFVQRRQNATDTLEKHHSFSNLLLSSDADVVRGRCNYLILRFDHDFSGAGGGFYHSYGSYEFVFCKLDGSWTITSIMQEAHRSWGSSHLHGGTRKAKT